MTTYFEKLHLICDAIEAIEMPTLQDFIDNNGPKKLLEKMKAMPCDSPEPDFEWAPFCQSFFVIFHEMRRYLTKKAYFNWHECYQLFFYKYRQYIYACKHAFFEINTLTDMLLRELFDLKNPLITRGLLMLRDNIAEFVFEKESFTVIKGVVYRLVKQTHRELFGYEVKPILAHTGYSGSRQPFNLYKVTPKIDADIIQALPYSPDEDSFLFYEPNAYFVY